ncbi:hypothetical protein J3459_008482 [Metarhizium acridum]|nr:hypothetical protein J3459_008482 [Metarhizium acridum]
MSRSRVEELKLDFWGDVSVAVFKRADREGNASEVQIRLGRRSFTSRGPPCLLRPGSAPSPGYLRTGAVAWYFQEGQFGCHAPPSQPLGDSPHFLRRSHVDAAVE